jgi:hypothetical protein
VHLTSSLPPSVEVWAFEYPAHGARAGPTVTVPSVAVLVDEQLAAVAPLLDKVPRTIRNSCDCES